MRKQYKAVPGSQLSDADAEVIGEELDLIQKVDKKIVPERVVEVAQNETSRLHKYFNWDDEDAAHQYRLEQARHLIRSITVEYIVEKENKETIRAFYNVADEENKHAYVSLESVMSNADYRQQVIEKALREAEGWANRYRQYEELEEIVRAIDGITVSV